MPNRIIRDGILSSERIAKLQWPEEVFFRRLMSVVDDYGRTDGNGQLLRSRCYPLQTESVRTADITRWIAACVKAGVLLSYEVSGKPYVQILDFRQQVRSLESKFPQSPTDATHLIASDSISNADAHSDVSVSVFGGVTPSPDGDGGAEEKAARAREKQNMEEETFSAFWKAYPKKVCKPMARQSWRKHGCAAQIDEILLAIERDKQNPDWRKEQGRFIPHPSTWLNQERWKDEGLTGFANGEEMHGEAKRIVSMSELIEAHEKTGNGQ